jgi:hypothetical protein
MLKYHIQTVELTSAQSSISFNNIPQDFTDLYIVTSHRQTQTFGDTHGYPGIRFNNSSSDYSFRRLAGDGSSASSGTSSGYIWVYGNNAAMTANTFSSTSFYIPNYTMPNSKSVSVDSVEENNATGSILSLLAGQWANTQAINSFTFFALDSALNNTPQFVAGTSISLYGVRRGSDGKTSPVAQGGVVTTSGGYTIHTFNTSGTFTAFRPLECEYLVVAGGGGGGDGFGGAGGGAGGYISSVTGELSGANSSAQSRISLISGASYAVTVGAGGASGASGFNSSLDTIVSIGGGRGGGNANGAPSIGGSGGGGQYGFTLTGALGTTNQGNAGGNGFEASGNVPGGGGGGASALGANATSANGGNGGNGISSSITGSSITRAGGGGGSHYKNSGGPVAGLGGSGGGGAGSISTGSVGAVGVSGTANTGGGGGGSANATTAGAGGSGVVIIRYLTP